MKPTIYQGMYNSISKSVLLKKLPNANNVKLAYLKVSSSLACESSGCLS